MCALLGYFTVSSGNSIPIFWDNFMMGPTGCPKTSPRNCHYMLRNILRDNRSHLLHGRSLISCMGHESVENRNLVNKLQFKFSCSILQIRKSNTKVNYDLFSLAIRFHNIPKLFHQMPQFIKMAVHKFSKNLAATSKF
jgi:hypothetical protein